MFQKTWDYNSRLTYLLKNMSMRESKLIIISRKYLLLEDEYKWALQEKKQKEAEINTERLQMNRIKKEKIRIKTLENELEKEVTKYD